MNATHRSDASVAEIPIYVVDASVVAKWHLKNEPHTGFAVAVQHDYEEGRIGLVAPDHFRYEVVSAFRKAILNRRIDVAAGHELVSDFLSWGIPAVDAAPLIPVAFEYCFRFSCTLYDGLYLALAQSQDLPFVYADNRLRNALDGRFPLAVWIEDYTN